MNRVACCIHEWLFTPVSNVADILQAKRDELAERKQQTPLEAVRALASMQGRPIPLLSSAMSDDEVMLTGQILYTPPSSSHEEGDPVAQAVRYARAGIDVISLFTDATIYSGGLDDLMYVVRAVQPFNIPVVSQDYIFDEYQVVEARAAGASGIVLDSALVDDATLRTLVSSTQRNRMTAIVRVADSDRLDAAIALSPQVISFSMPLPQTRDAVSLLRRLRQRVPPHIRVALTTPMEQADDLTLVAKVGFHGVVLPDRLISPSSLIALRARLAACGD
jgi:indole-3-glycerol phosphate synthase